ncbi:MAG: hypothetical protein EP329_07660 [Deltaproteobacteria bacterium]|nr:MAG: hypothetical protein EP329_07660 [Deltaproteobacteria bacterium]
MRWLFLALFTLSSLGCPPKEVPDPPAVGASAKDGQKVRQPDPPKTYAAPGAPEDAGAAREGAGDEAAGPR